MLSAISRIGLVQRYGRRAQKLCLHCSTALHDSDSPSDGNQEVSAKVEKVSNAMKLYLAKVGDYKKKMAVEVAEYELGKRHLANIMGMDPETFTEKDLKDSLQYLFPSGLTEKKARPILQHPSKLYPPMKEAQFGMDGRPHHYMFYTTKPLYHQLMHQLASTLNTLDFHQYRLGQLTRIEYDNQEGLPTLDLGRSTWINQNTLRRITDSNIDDDDYERFTILMDRLVEHPRSITVKDLIQRYRVQLDVNLLPAIPEPKKDKDERLYSTEIGNRKNAVATVTVYNPGTGLLSINGKDLDYFPNIQEREQLLFPLKLAGKIGKVDIIAEVEGGGPTGQAGAIRLAMSLALRPFVSEEVLLQMRLAGLLTRDPRIAERKKTGQPGARKKFTWKRR